MRLAVSNVENLFDRPKAMNLGTWKDGKPILQDFAALSQLLGEVNYTASLTTKSSSARRMPRKSSASAKARRAGATSSASRPASS